MKELFQTFFTALGAIVGHPQTQAPPPAPVMYATPMPRPRPDALRGKVFIGPYELPPAHVQLNASRG